MKPEEIAKLWMNENSIVNQKTAYYTAVNAGLVAVLKDVDCTAATVVCLVGAVVSFFAWLSLSRTCACNVGKAWRSSLRS